MGLDSLQKALHRWEAHHINQQHIQFQRLQQAWPEIVGSVVAAQTKPIAIHGKRLKVTTASSAWAQNLVFERQRLLEKVNYFFDVPLTDIWFTPGQWQTSQTAAQSNQKMQSAEMWQAHPSRLDAGLPFDRISALDAADAFQTWSQLIQSRSSTLPLCPTCKSPTPVGELERWRVCALCAAQQWNQK
jgi:predicted nucleic acid-binding Zn ribbon protein